MEVWQKKQRIEEEISFILIPVYIAGTFVVVIKKSQKRAKFVRFQNIDFESGQQNNLYRDRAYFFTGYFSFNYEHFGIM